MHLKMATKAAKKVCQMCTSDDMQVKNISDCFSNVLRITKTLQYNAFATAFYTET